MAEKAKTTPKGTKGDKQAIRRYVSLFFSDKRVGVARVCVLFFLKRLPNADIYFFIVNFFSLLSSKCK